MSHMCHCGTRRILAELAECKPGLPAVSRCRRYRRQADKGGSDDTEALAEAHQPIGQPELEQIQAVLGRAGS
jgi:hypothetical protein